MLSICDCSVSKIGTTTSVSVEEVKDEYELSFPGLRFFSFPRIRFHGPEIRGNPQEKL